MIPTVNLTNFSNKDERVALYHLGLRNAAITTENARLLALTPPGTPLPLLAVGTPNEIKQSYEAFCAEGVLGLHVNWSNDAAENNATARQIKDILRAGPTQAQLNAMLAAGTA